MKRIVWDMAKCTGCRVCEAICSLVKEGEINPVKARAKVVRTVERSILHKVRVTCLQCEEPNCKAVCPTGAITLDNRGVKVTDEEKCIGCKMCEVACPVGAIAVNAEKGVSIKCDLCAGLEEPQCVKYCYPGSLQYLPDERVGITLARAKAEKYVEMATKEA